VSGRPPSADEPDRVLVDLRVNHEQQAAAVRLPEQNQPFWVLGILCDACERVIEHGFGLSERHSMLAGVGGGFLSVPAEEHNTTVTLLMEARNYKTA